MKSARKPFSIPDSGISLKTHSRKFIQFCIVGGSGVFVDMGLFGFLADPHFLGIHITAAKIIAASVAMLSNFSLNEFWTFQETGKNHRSVSLLLYRLIKFCGICSIGIIIATSLLNLFVTFLGINIHLANFLAIIIAAFWNYLINAKFNWNLR